MLVSEVIAKLRNLIETLGSVAAFKLVTLLQMCRSFQPVLLCQYTWTASLEFGTTITAAV
jgi:hypothetical protein